MKVYEMILSISSDEQERILYHVNNASTRTDFLARLKLILDQEWISSKVESSSSDQIAFDEQIYYESLQQIEMMSDDFIAHGTARLTKNIFMPVLVRDIIKI